MLPPTETWFRLAVTVATIATSVTRAILFHLNYSNSSTIEIKSVSSRQLSYTLGSDSAYYKVNKALLLRMVMAIVAKFRGFKLYTSHLQ